MKNFIVALFASMTLISVPVQAHEQYQLVMNHQLGTVLIPISGNNPLRYDDWYDCFIMTEGENIISTVYVSDASNEDTYVIETGNFYQVDMDMLSTVMSHRDNKCL